MKKEERKMKYEIFLVFILALSFFLIAGSNAEEINITNPVGYVIDHPNFEVKMLRYEPYPVEPGEYFKLDIKAENFGEKEAPNATCILELNYPFSIDSGSSLERNYGKLGALQEAILEFERIRVDENAVEGDNKITVKCSANPSSGEWNIQDFIIKVQTRYSTLNVISVKTQPEMIAPGEKAVLSIVFENSADSSMKDVQVELNLSSVPIAPFNEIPQKKIKRINAKETSQLDFNIIAMTDAKGGIYKIPLTIMFTDELGKQYNQSTILGIEIGSKTEIYAIVDATTISTASKIGTISIKIVNRGLTDLHFVDAELMEDKKYNIISSSKVYIGDLSSDDYETAEFRLEAKSNKIILPLKLDYRDASNKQYTEQMNIEFNLSSPEELGKPRSSTGIIIILVILAIIFYTRYRKWKKANQEKGFGGFLTEKSKDFGQFFAKAFRKKKSK